MTGLLAPVAPAALLVPILLQIGWTLFLYAWLTARRLRAVGRKEAQFATFEFGLDEPPAVARLTRNLANQFEFPVIVYFAVAVLIALGEVRALDVAAAWLFLGGRVAHTLVQTNTGNVPLRGAVFTINFVAGLAIVAHLALVAFASLGGA